MPIPKKQFFELIKSFNFKSLFNEMGWERDAATPLTVNASGQPYTLSRIAQKRGYAIFQCSPDAYGNLPNNQTRRKIFIEVQKHHHENLIIFCDQKKHAQVWHLEVKSPGKPIVRTEAEWNHPKTPEALWQKLAPICFELDDEENITLIDVKKRVQDNFQQNNERVTRQFYDKFKVQHDAFKALITGIDNDKDREWYTCVMLNRLMFVYFIQKKGFLDGNIHYLRDKLKQVQESDGRDQYHKTFYRYFLLKLFHDGLGKREHSEELEQLLGKVPYLNGGFFDVHEIEARHAEQGKISIDIPDAAFEKLFAFFDEWNWHLDTRHTASGKDINPDVVGYIFEKYINQKQMGAYYTKEDITEYISKNTILPFLLEKTKEKMPEYFAPGSPLWKLLSENFNRYIYESVQKGVDIPLPEHIAVGLDTTQPNLIERRQRWNESATAEFALPTETWREHVARRNRCLELRQKMRAGNCVAVNDLITYNLDIRQFVSDALDSAEDQQFVEYFYEALKKITILDPTCGSGAFLFAAMNILEPLYESCQNALQNTQKSRKHNIGKDPYTIYKHIILHNLYGVDIMEEAVEICKLRLFLKLAALVESVDAVEPLPDIDFNIRSGNALIGYANIQQIEDSQKGKLAFSDEVERLQRRNCEVALIYNKFREAQLDETTANFAKVAAPSVKEEYRKQLAKLNEQLNRYLAGEYGIDVGESQSDDCGSETYRNFLQSHRPFHWWVEFYAIMQNGGFDVIIGNPPYVEYSKVKRKYTIKSYKTESCGNLYAMVIEQSLTLLGITGKLGMIVPISLPSTPRMNNLRTIVSEASSEIYISNFADRPGTLFSGVHQKVSILLSGKGTDCPTLFTTNFVHWYSRTQSNERNTLMTNFTYHDNALGMKTWYKTGHPIECSIHSKLRRQRPLSDSFISVSEWIAVLNMRMMFWSKCFIQPKVSNEYKSFCFKTEQQRDSFMALMNSSLFFYFWETLGDCWHVTNRELNTFTYNLDCFSGIPLATLGIELENDLESKKGYVGSVQTEYEYYHKLSKPTIDRIDTLLAEHYGFTEEELDFIINYDIKYRMGLGGEDDVED